MVITTDKAIEIIEEFLTLVSSKGIKIERAVLFGSYARGMATEWSDIDLAITSSDFVGIPFHDRGMLTECKLKVDWRLQIFPYRPEEFTEESLFAKEIIETGIEIKLPITELCAK
ncbi:MAG: nucleotidyltransferase domain-containing protein [Nitrospirae bacterium]|nr:nucleotidyltransferase domain-containing protein [Nitrospirota bacterium]